jgi:hypothetical protein
MSSAIERFSTAAISETGAYGRRPDFFAACATVRIARKNMDSPLANEEGNTTSTGSNAVAVQLDRGSEQCTMNGSLNGEALRCNSILQLKEPIGLLPQEFSGLGIDDLGKCALLHLLANSVIRDTEPGQSA